MTSSRGPYQALKPVGPLGSMGQRIRAVRIAWGWTQGALAQALGTAQGLVSEWERGVSKPTSAALTALANLYRVPVVALETGKGFKVPDPPDAMPARGPMSKRDIQDLSKLLPNLAEGEILHVDAAAEDSEIMDLTATIEALRKAQQEGRRVWVVVGKRAKRK